jgi:hypothetical protein
MRSPLGKPLSYSHVVALAKVEDETERKKLLKQAIEREWTSTKLANAVDLSKAPPPEKKPDGRGRPIGKPKTFDALLDQQDHFARDFLNRNSEVWSHAEHSLSAKAHFVGTEEITKERADRLREHAERLTLLAEKAKERADEAMQLHKRFMDVLEARDANLKKVGCSVSNNATADDPA